MSANASAGAGMLVMLCRYKKVADWTLLSDLVQENPTLPLIGNGDILTHYEAADR
jgi:tRNA-dihydrouridine synthase